MTQIITVLAPFTLAGGKTEADLLDASAIFQRDFVSGQPAILRREIVRKGEGRYLDIVQFRSREDMARVMELEQESPACHMFFAVIDMSEADAGSMEAYVSLASYPGA